MGLFQYKHVVLANHLVKNKSCERSSGNNTVGRRKLWKEAVDKMIRIEQIRIKPFLKQILSRSLTNYKERRNE